MMMWMGLVFAAIALTFVEFRVLGFSLERKGEE
jgi:hypothetical protein